MTYTGPTWSWSATGASVLTIVQPDKKSAGATLQATIYSPGSYTITATATATWQGSDGIAVSASKSAAPITLVVVGVSAIQYLDPLNGYVNATSTLYVLVGHSVDFKAIPTPAGTAFPAGNPVWSGTSGASGTGQTITVTFPTLSASTSDFKTVIATCGNTSMTANVIVYQLTPVVTPEDNFAGRDLTTCGVCELLDLSFTTLPIGLTESEIGGLQWVIASGGGVLTGGVGGTGTYQCSDVADTVTLALEITGGVMFGQQVEVVLPIVPPDGAKVLQQNGTMLWHNYNSCSVGFCGDCYATCMKAVSFKEIQVREGECLGKATGLYKDRGLDGLKHPAVDLWFNLKTLVVGKGYQSDFSGFTRQYDKIASGTQDPPYSKGTFTWPIPCHYRNKTTGTIAAMPYATNTQYWESDDAGMCTINKAGSGNFSSGAGDATTTPKNWNEN